MTLVSHRDIRDFWGLAVVVAHQCSLSGGEASLAGNQHLTAVVDTDEAMKYSNVSVNFHNLKIRKYRNKDRKN
jgi:hypothetical protein